MPAHIIVVGAGIAGATAALGLRDAGFDAVGWRDYSFGIACLHHGVKA